MRIFLLYITISAIAFLCACETDELVGHDLAIARNAQAERDWPLAERVLRRYLREEQDSDKRWEAWMLLLGAMNGASQEPRASLECLDVMLVEYEGNDPRVSQILAQMGRYNEALHNWDRAANAWSAYLELECLSLQERIEGFRRLAAALLAQRHFDAAEEVLEQCLALPASDHDKVWCMLDLADAGVNRQQWQNVADLCQQILDADPPLEVQGLAGYMAGDALEQMGRPREALEQFEKNRDNYPNPAVMDNRIDYLRKHLRARDK